MTSEPVHRLPTVVSRGRLPAHGLGIPAQALCLDGEWNFRPWRGDQPAFPAPDEGQTVTVPGSWVLQGDGAFGIPIYTNVVYPFAIDGYPHIPIEDEGGDHLTTAVVPSEWDGSQIVLRIGGAESAVEVFIDGASIGYSTDSRLPAEFDVTEFARPGEELTIGLRVHRWSASTWLEDQDMWWMAGLHRSVHLCARPPARVADLFVRTELKDGLARVSVDVETTGVAAGEKASVSLTSVDPSSASVDAAAEAVIDDDGRCTVTLELAGPPLWSAETPNLVDCTVEVAGDRVTRRTGIRTVEAVGGRLLVNGVPVTIYGVNRHEHDGVHGRWQSDADMVADLELIAASNINAIRTAHYPNDERFYALADEMGFYVFDEANIETHGLVFEPDALPANDPDFADAFVARGERMVLRDRNHPSVIAWSLGNEAGFGPNHRLMADAVRAVDPTRPIAYHPAEDDPVVDIIGPMYPPVDELEELARTADDRPIIMCEYSHAMGNSNGGLAEYWDLIDRSQRAWGGFIWDWVDQGLERRTEDGTRWWAYGGDFGDEPNDRNFNCNGLVDADRRPHPALTHVAWMYRPVVTVDVDAVHGVLRATNRRSMTDTSDLELRWSLVVDGDTRAEGAQPHEPIGPGESADIRIGAIDRPTGGEARLRIEWWGGDQLRSWDEIPLADIRPPLPATVAPSGPTSIDRVDDGIVLRGGDTEVHIDGSGVPTEFRFGDDRIAVDRGRLGIWRPPTDNDDATFGDEMLVSRLIRAGLDQATPERTKDWSIDGTGRGRRGDGSSGPGTTSAGTRFAFGPDLSMRVTWTIGPEGDLAFGLHVDAGLHLPPLLRAGLELELDGSHEAIEWFGPGPEESYPDRLDGLAVARHRSTATDSFFPYARPQETGNRTDLRWFAIRSGENGRGLLAVGDRRFDAAALHAWSEDITAARHPHEIEWTDRTVLRLDGAHAGLGTGSCGPGVAVRHQVVPYHVRARIVLRHLAPGDDAATVAAPISTTARHRRWHY